MNTIKLLSSNISVATTIFVALIKTMLISFPPLGAVTVSEI
jgi:hypothetical protein